jgi:hypothetical protein
MRTPFKLASGPATPPVSQVGPFRDEFRRWPLTLSPPLGETPMVTQMDSEHAKAITRVCQNLVSREDQVAQEEHAFCAQ